MKESETKAIFRKDTEYGDVIAFFPETYSKLSGCIHFYSHIGQHGETDDYFFDNYTIPATNYESRQLKKELESRGYHIKISKSKKLK